MNGRVAVLGSMILAVVGMSAYAQLQPFLFERETEYSRRIARDFIKAGQSAVTEAIQPEGSRVDVLTDEFAYEVEWVSKWKEAVGQSLLYGLQTNRQPGIILLLRGEAKEDENYLRCLSVCAKVGIRLEVRKAKDLIP